ncbi:uncharacterized protein FFFS_01222 [Fusarium fujikuroi]|nr:uncharacterized protein FFFS_01222 [Fusarium fujikuroi]
MPYIASSFF